MNIGLYGKEKYTKDEDSYTIDRLTMELEYDGKKKKGMPCQSGKDPPSTVFGRHLNASPNTPHSRGDQLIHVDSHRQPIGTMT